MAKLRILIVDDDPDIMRALCLRMNRAGYETIAAVDIRSAQRAALEQSPDAMLIDGQLGEEDGVSLVRAFKRHPATAGIPMIVVSGWDSIQREAIAAGASAFVLKPYQTRELFELLEQLTQMAGKD